MRVLGRLLVVSLVGLVVGLSGGATSQEASTVDVIKVTGLLDDRLTDFVLDTVDLLVRESSELVIIQIDSAGAIQESIFDLISMVEEPPLPLAVWVGPEPAVAFGGAVRVLAAAPIRAAAPLATVGYADPAVAGVASDDPAGLLSDEAVSVAVPIPGVVDIVQPSLSQLVADLDGVEVLVANQPVTLDTVIEKVDDEGNAVVHPVPTRFWEPGLGTSLLRLGASPDTALFFLVLGLAVVAFEFYALGPGLAAATGGLSLLLAGYGLAVLPLTAWAVAAVLLGMVALVVQFQRTARIGLLTLLGLVLLLVGGFWFTSAAPQFGTSAPAVILTAAVAVFFTALALPAVTRARLSTATIGREYLVGRIGTAAGTFTAGEGTVEVDGATWRAQAHREAELSQGDEVVVTAVLGVFVEVEPVSDEVAKTK